MIVGFYTRTDGLLEPASEKAINLIGKQKPASLLLAEVKSNNRTALQNRYLNGWIYKLAYERLNESGQLCHGVPWTRNTLHAMFQEMYLVRLEFKNPVTGEICKEYESTADMSRKRFTEYINDQIRPFMSQAFNIEIEDPPNGDWDSLLREIYK